MIPNFKIKFFTSSHGCRHRFLPDILKQKQLCSNILPQIEINAKGGRKFNSSVFDLIKASILKDLDNHQLVIILLGDNNIRSFQNQREFKTLYNLTAELVEFVNSFPNVKLLLSSLLPSPATEHYTFTLFKEYNNFLLNLAILHENTYYLCTDKIFSVRGKTRNRLFSDGIHLNEIGANVLATVLIRKIKQILLKLT